MLISNKISLGLLTNLVVVVVVVVLMVGPSPLQCTAKVIGPLRVTPNAMTGVIKYWGSRVPILPVEWGSRDPHPHGIMGIPS